MSAADRIGQLEAQVAALLAEVGRLRVRVGELERENADLKKENTALKEKLVRRVAQLVEASVKRRAERESGPACEEAYGSSGRRPARSSEARAGRVAGGESERANRSLPEGM